MIRGTIVGEVWATRKHPALAGAKLILVAEQELSDSGFSHTGRLVVARDRLDARAGQTVLVAFGSGARRTGHLPPNFDVLADAAVVQVVDDSSQED